jgi:hypothetical protein
MFQAKIHDGTDSLIATFARENGAPVLGGLTARQYQTFLEEGDAEEIGVVRDYLDSQCVLQTYNICLKAKYENFRGECSLKFYAVKVVPL